MNKKTINIALAGNPNSGKTTLFNEITGTTQTTGNWPGVTVTKKTGKCSYEDTRINVTDLPGTYSLSAHSEDELIARDFVVKEKPDVVINVVDATALSRNLFLTIQLIELGAPVVVALNMTDEAKKSQLDVNPEMLSQILGVPVVETVGTCGSGVKTLIQKAVELAEDKEKSCFVCHYGADVESATQRIQNVLSETQVAKTHYPLHFFAHKLLERDKRIEEEIETIDHPEKVHQIVEEEMDKLREKYGDDVETLVINRRYEMARNIAYKVTSNIRKPNRVTEILDRILTNRFLGIPIFLAIMYGIYFVTFTYGAYLSDLVGLGVEWISGLFDSLASFGIPAITNTGAFLNGVVTEGVGGVIVFLPFIAVLFIFMSFLEGSGYMARIAYIMDGIMSSVGLSGKAFIPYMVSFGCAVPGVMAARTLDTNRERVLTVLTTPLVACATRMEVLFFLAAVAFVSNPLMQSLSVWIVFALGIVLAIVLVSLFSRIFYKNEKATPILIELPPYRLPSVKNILLHSWNRTKHFLEKAGGVILFGAIAFWILSSTPSNILSLGSNAVISTIVISSLLLWLILSNALPSIRKRIKAPIIKASNIISLLTIVAVYIIGIMPVLPTDVALDESIIGTVSRGGQWLVTPLGLDWRALVALVAGFVAKELVISVFNILGTGVGEMDSSSTIREWYSPQAVLGLMIFMNLYVPCLATIGAIKAEIGWKWALFSVGYSLALAWIVSFIVYRVGLLF